MCFLFSLHTPHYEQILPEGWCITDIGELLINRDGERKPVSLAIRSKQINKVYDYYGAAGVIDKVDSYLFEERLLLVGEDGANLLSRNKNNAFLADGKYWVNNHAHVLDAIDKLILSYVAIVINSMKLDDYITGSAQPKLSQDNLNKIPIFLPPLDEQKRIMTELERWFTIIDQIEQGKTDLQTIVKQTKSKILELAIHGKLVPQDPNDEPAIELLKRINPNFTPCDNEHDRKLPQIWTWVKGKNIFLPMKSVKPCNEDFLYIDIDSIDNKHQVINKIKTIKTFDAPSRASRYTQKDDVVFSMVRPYLRNIAKVVNNNCIASTGFYICSPIPKILHPNYCYYLMISDYVVNGLNQFMKGDNSPSINKIHIDEWLFPLPPFAEQHRIVQKIEELFSALDNIQKSLEV
ncbi:restriction endonuclease subunit S [Bacteroides fragilis]|nr:restriction endonuclease subunit S [Bacteroides fragilis]